MKKTTVMAFLLALLAPMMSAWANAYSYKAVLKVSVADTGGGKVYASKSSTDKGELQEAIESGKTSEEGEDVTVKLYAYAEPEYGYEFEKWSDGGIQNHEVSITCKSSKKEVTKELVATFKPRTDLTPFNITFETSNSGTYTVNGASPVDKPNLTTPTSIKLETADSNFLNWVINGNAIAPNPYTATYTADTTISANFITADQVTTAETYEALVAALANDQYLKITIPSGKEIVVAKGATLTIPAGKQLVVDGSLVVVGTVAGAGTIAGNGTLYKISYLIDQSDVITIKTAYGKDCEHLNFATDAHSDKMPRYCRTEVTKNIPTVGVDVSMPSDKQSWGVLLNGASAYAIAVQNPVAVKVAVDTTKENGYQKAVNKITSVIGTVTNTKLTDTANYVLFSDCSLTGPLDSSKLANQSVVDCAGSKISATVNTHYKFCTLCLNGTVYFSASQWQNAKAAFFNCSSIEIYGIKNVSPSYAFYDCGTETSPCVVKFGYYTETRTDDYRKAAFYSGCYDVRPTFNDADDGGGKCTVYGGSYTSKPIGVPTKTESVNGEEVEIETTDPTVNGTKYWVVEKKEEKHDVAAIGSSTYPTLEKAIEAADASGSVITLQENITLGENAVVTIPDTKSLTIVLNGRSISGGKIVNEGTLLLTDTATANCTTVLDLSGGEVSSTIENNKTLDIVWGCYKGAIINNAAGTLTVSNGRFEGQITNNGGAIALKGGHFKKSVFAKDALVGLGVVDTSKIVTSAEAGVDCYTVCAAPNGDLVPNDDGYVLTPFNDNEYPLLLGWIKGKNTFASYSTANWKLLAQLLAFYQAFNGNVIDAALSTDRNVVAETLELTGSLGNRSYPLSPATTAGNVNRILSTAMVNAGWSAMAYKYTFTHEMGPFKTVGFSATTKGSSGVNNNGTICRVGIELWSGSSVVYTLGQKVFAIGSGSNLAMIRPAEGEATFYATLGGNNGIVNAVADCGTIMLANNCAEDLVLTKVGTYTFDTMGFAYTGATPTVADGLFVKSTADAKSEAKIIVPDAVATTYVVAQKVAGVGAKFYDNLVDAVGAANGETVTLYAATDETITLTAEGQSFTLNKNGVAFDDAKVVTTIANGSVTKSVTDAGTVYTAVTSVVDASDGNKYTSVGAAVATVEGNDVSVTVTVNVTEEVALPQGKALTVKAAEGVEANVTVTPGDGAFIVESAVEGGTKYESKRITETYSGEEAALSGNGAIVRADNAAAAELKEIAVTLVSTEKTGGAIRKATFEVTPKDANGEAMGGKLSGSYVFRLPVDAAATQLSAIVYHGAAQFGVYPVQTWKGAKFIEVESSSFSPYGYELLDGETANPVAAIGMTGYASLAAAVAAAQSGETITMLADDDVSLTNGETLTIDKSLIITGPVDEDGKPLYTISGTAGQTGNNNIFITGNGTVTLSNLNIAGFGNDCSTDASHAPVYVASTFTGTVNLDNLSISDFNRGGVFLYGGTFNVTDCTIDCENDRTGAFTKGIEIRNSASGKIEDTTIVNMTSESDESVAGGIEFYGNGNVTVSGCTIEGDSFGAIGVGTAGFTDTTTTGTITVEDCEITVWYAALYASALGEGLGTNGTTMRVTSGEYSADNYVVSADYGTVKISGGNFIGLLDVSGDGNGSIAISGGTFDDEIPEEYCADGYIPAVYDEELGLYTVRTGSYVAQNMTTDTKYESFGAALADAQDGDTVQLLANITGVTETYNIDKTLTIDGQGQYKIAAGENSSPRNVISAWSGPRVMFDLTRSTANVTFNNVTMDNGEGHYYSYFVRAKSGTATFEDVVLLRGAEKDSSGTAGAGYGAAILADGGNIVVKGDFYADTHGKPLVENQQGDKTAGIFPFTAILHQDGGIYFEDGVNANIGQDLLLVGKQNEDMLDASDEAVKAKIQAMLDAMNVPSGYVPYTLNLADSAQLSFIGASPLGWNNIIDYGKGIMDVAADAYGMTGLDKTTTPVEVGLLDDTVLTETFTYEDSNFTVNGNGNTLSGTIEYTDNAGTLENVVMGTEEAPLVLDMTGLSEGKSIDLGTGIAASNVTIKVTEEQATTLGQNIVTWNTEGESEEAAASLEKGITVEIVDDEGEPVMDPVSGDPMEASIIWDAELGVAYIGPCEARLTGPTHANPIYTSLASAIALAADSGDTVTLMTNIVNFTGTQQISKSSLVLDGAGHTIAAAPVATHRNVVNAFLGGTSLLEIESGAVTVKNITLDGDASHAYTYLISANNDSASLTTENITLLHGGELCGDDNGDLLEAGAGYGAAIHLNNGAHLTVKDGFYADTHGAPAEEGQTVAKADGVFPFTGILPEGGSSVLFDLTEDTNAEPTVEIGKDLLLVGMVGAIDSDTAQGILDYMQVPSRFRPYTLTLGDGSAYAFTGASLLGWNEIIDYGKEIMDVSTAVGYEGLDKDETPVEVGLLTDTVLPETFTYEDSNFTVNGNGNALSGTIKYTDDAGVIENIVLGTEEAPLVLDLRNIADPVEIGNLISVSNVTVLMTEEQATLGQPVFTWNTETAQEPENSDLVVITVLESAGTPYDPEEETITKGLVWDDELGIAYIGPCEARLTGPEREPGYMDLTNAFNMAVGGDTVTLFWSGVTLNEEIAFPAGTLVFATNKYELALGENAAFVFTNATSVFRSELEFSTDIMTLEGKVASGYLLRTATDGTTNVYSVASRGQYIVTGMTEDGMDGTAVIKVSDEWIAANMNKVIAEIKTINEIEEYLDSRDATTGMRKWENYVLRQTTNPFRVSGLAANGALSTTLSDTPEATATTGFTVRYALNEVKADGTVKTPGTKSAGHNFSVAVDSVADSALYKVRAYLTSGESTLVVDSTNTIGVLKVQPTIARSIIAVPWKSLATGGDITVADYIRAADLSDGDKLHVYNGSSYDTWTYSGGGLIPSTTFIVGSDGVTSTEPSPAAEKTLARGTGVWLERASGTAKNLYLIGEYTPEPVETPITAGSKSAMSWNLVGAPSYEQIDLNTAIGEPVNKADRIVVPMPGGLQKNFTYKNDTWGYSDARTIEVNGRTRVQTFHNTNTVLPAGTGFWYLNTGDTGTIKW